MRIFTVAHTFKGEEDVELTVRKGESVKALDNVVQDGWIKVQVRSDASRQGFVPISYLREDSTEEKSKDSRTASLAGAGRSAETTPRRPTSQSAAAKTVGAANDPSASPAAEAAAVTDVSSVRGSPYHPSPAKVASPERVAAARAPASEQPLRPTTLTPAQAATGPVSHTLLQNPDAVVESFMKNEVYFKQLMRKRAEAVTNMQNSLEEAMTEVAACKDRNAALARKLRDLDQAIEREHHRWEDRVVEEKDYISRSLAYTGGGGMAAVGSYLALEGVAGSTRSTPQRGIRAEAEL